MNNVTRYTLDQARFAEAQKRLELTSKAALDHVANARSIARKFNSGRLPNDELIARGYEWASPYARNHRVVSYGENAITIQYTTGLWHKPEVKTFEMPVSDLSLSVWAYNKGVREAFKTARRLEKSSRAKEKLAEIQAARQALRTQETKVSKLVAELEALEATQA